MPNDLNREGLEAAAKAVDPRAFIEPTPVPDGRKMARKRAEAAIRAYLAHAKPDTAALVEAARKAIQLGEIATDWNLPEVEIDGQMVSTYALIDEFRAALSTVPAKSAKTVVAVKPLLWAKNPDGDFTKAETAVGNYSVWTHHEAEGKWFWSFRPRHVGPGGPWEGTVASEAEALAACQADYEQRVLSCLLPAAAGVPEGFVLGPVEPTEAMLDAFWHQTGESKEMRGRVHARARRYYRAMLAARPAEDGGVGHEAR